MLWQGRRESENVEDVRGSGGNPAAALPAARPAHSIAPRIDVFTSTLAFTVYCTNALVREAISRKPM